MSLSIKHIKMKTVIVLFLTFLGQFALAQQDVYLNINHFLGTSPFAFNQLASNNLGNEFKVNRLEYYIAEITLTHDGGIETRVNDLWILASAENTTSEFLGSFPITELESVSFSIGVEQDYNHLDPATYPVSHPLGPKSPSMHWGWNSGYRFLAMEGLSGVNHNLLFEIHALGDANYLTTRVSANGTMDNGNLMINLDADYERLLDDTDISSGTVSHGETGLPADVLRNFSRFVFSVSAGDPASVTDIAHVVAFKTYPNPSTRMVRFSSDVNGPVDVKILNVAGKEIQSVNGVELNNLTLELEAKGLYLVNVYQSGHLIGYSRLSVVK